MADMNDTCTEHLDDFGPPSVTAYTKGCRCQKCRNAISALHNRERAAKLRGERLVVPTAETQTLINALRMRGMSLREIAECAGVGRNAVTRISSGHVKYVKSSTHAAIAAVADSPRRTPKPHTLVSAARLRAEITRWHDAGVTYAHLALVTGVSQDTLQRIACRERKTVQAETVMKVMHARADLDALLELDADELRYEVRGVKQRHCAHCGRTYSYGNASRRYCSEKCRLAARRESTTVSGVKAAQELAASSKSTADIAAQSGVPYDTVWRILTNKRKYVLKTTWEKIAQVL